MKNLIALHPINSREYHYRGQVQLTGKTIHRDDPNQEMNLLIEQLPDLAIDSPVKGYGESTHVVKATNPERGEGVVYYLAVID